MYQWESNSDTVICQSDLNTSHTEGYKSAKDNTGSLDSSLSDHWMSIIGRVNEEPLLEDEAVPEVELCVSSPETVDFASIDNTLLESEPTWRQVSDESFIRMEQLVASPLKREKITEKTTDLDQSNLIVFSPLAKRVEKFSKLSNIVENDNTGVHSDEKYETCDSYNSSSEQKHILDRTNICNNTLEDVESYSADSESNSNDNPNALMVDNSLCSSQNSGIDESLNFNDTLEEMEHLIKYGMDYMISKNNKKAAEKSETAKMVSSIESSNLDNTPILKNDKENKFKLRSPRLVFPSQTSNVKPSFKPPSKTPTPVKKRFFYKSPPTPQSIKPSPAKYDNILSPVQYYIKNSPVVPKIKNVSPGINLWEKHAQRAPSSGAAVRGSQDKGIPLQEKAYKCSVTTKLVETLPKQRLPKNQRVGVMAESLPKPIVIKHERREVNPLKEHNKQGSCTTALSSHVDESYANLALMSGDVSLCVKKSAIRTHTLK